MGRKRKNTKSVTTVSHKEANRNLKRVLFSNQYKPKVIPNKKKLKINKGFEDEY